MDNDLKSILASLVTARCDPNRRIPLTGHGCLRPLGTITVCDPRMVGGCYTPHMSGALVSFALDQERDEEDACEYQIIEGPVLSDWVVMLLAEQIVMVPAYDWTVGEVIILLVKMTGYGWQLLHDLTKLYTQYPDVKVSLGWDGKHSRHSILDTFLTEQEAVRIQSVAWPTREKIQEVLSSIAFTDMEKLLQANHRLRAAVYSRGGGRDRGDRGR